MFISYLVGSGKNKLTIALTGNWAANGAETRQPWDPRETTLLCPAEELHGGVYQCFSLP
jgi:hypothetical protein